MIYNIFIKVMTTSSQIKFSFKNLEPANYLKTFNKMVDYQSRQPQSQLKKPQLKVIPYTRFPIPKDYENMQGIFENVNKKKIQSDLNRYNREIQQQEKFIKKHNDFMRKILAEFIEHNESRQKLFERQKNHYKGGKGIHHLRTQSQPKLDRIKRDVKLKQKTNDNQSEKQKATLGSSMVLSEQEQQVENPALPKLKPRKKNEKYMVKKQRDMQLFIINRKLANPQSQTTLKPSSSPQDNGQALDLKDEIVTLQKKQAKIQSNFTKRIQKEISQFGQKMNIQVHAIKYYNFWNQNPKVDAILQQKQRKLKNKLQQIRQTQQRADFKIQFRNYQSN